ncbi:hypothetical protein CDAR_558371 [Caerostris darwini]|uniref:Uncharacterized protein n=1 Tax=Caerostris darwini TaxID=1538125 RepID=A0AAV4UP93_9ARAC|nr:hypothetical protein CDAR_558371 [Caerostris darwini]
MTLKMVQNGISSVFCLIPTGMRGSDIHEGEGTGQKKTFQHSGRHPLSATIFSAGRRTIATYGGHSTGRNGHWRTMHLETTTDLSPSLVPNNVRLRFDKYNWKTKAPKLRFMKKKNSISKFIFRLLQVPSDPYSVESISFSPSINSKKALFPTGRTLSRPLQRSTPNQIAF